MHGQLILESLARIEASGDVPARSKEIQAVYERVARNWGHDPLTTLKSIQNHLADLTMLGFLERTEQNEGRAGGVHYRYELALDPEIILETRESIENQP
jgi:Cdc6-like AAA superfamily ATPase